jgi:two-component system LytT family response regulator
MKIAIIEDETAAAANLEAMLRKLLPEAEIAPPIESVAESVAWLSEGAKPDLLFMDIHLADGDSFRIFDSVEVTCPIIFTTAYDKYALEAFKVNSIDYLLKPLKEAELRRALDKLKRLSAPEKEAYNDNLREAVRRSDEQRLFLIPVRDKIVPLKLSEIAFFHTYEEKVRAYTLDGNSYPMDRSLDKLSKMLDPTEFFRANRQFIVARRAIKDISVWFGSRLSLNLAVKIPERMVVSKDRVPEFKRWFTGA